MTTQSATQAATARAAQETATRDGATLAPTLLTLPHDALMCIVLAAKAARADRGRITLPGGATDAVTLSSLLCTCRQLHTWLNRHWARIVAHYTVVLYHLTDGTCDSDGEQRDAHSDDTDDDSADTVRELSNELDLLYATGNDPVNARIMKQVLLCGRLHYVGAPAVIVGSRREYHVYGQLHRDNDLPAIESRTIRKWYRRGMQHRDGDKPAVIDEHSAHYMKNGSLHRDGDLPAMVVRTGGAVRWEWYKHGQRHRRLRGGRPAFIEADVPGEATPDDLTVAAMDTYPDATMLWYYRGLLHRDGDLPASIEPNHMTRWYVYGQLHREGGPAVVRANGHESWYLDGSPVDPRDLEDQQ